MADPLRPTIFALSSGRPPAAIAVVRMSGPQARAALRKLIGRVPRAAPGGARARARSGKRRCHRRGAGALVPGAAQRDRRGHGRAAAARRPRGDRRGARRARPDRRVPAGGGGRVHAPRFRERPARSDRGGRPCRPDRGRDRGAAAAGVPPAQGPARRPRRSLAPRP